MSLIFVVHISIVVNTYKLLLMILIAYWVEIIQTQVNICLVHVDERL